MSYPLILEEIDKKRNFDFIGKKYPVSNDEFNVLWTRAYAHYLSHTQKNNLLATFLRIMTKDFFRILDFSNFVLLIQRQFSPAEQEQKTLEIFDKVFVYFDSEKVIKDSLAITTLKTIKAKIYNFRHYFKFEHFIKQHKKVYTIEVPYDEYNKTNRFQHYTKNNNFQLNYVHPQFLKFLIKNKEKTTLPDKNLQEDLRQFLQQLFIILQESDVHLSASIQKNIEYYFQQKLLHYYPHWLALKRITKQQKINHLLSVSIGNLFLRLLAEAVKANGGEVTTFSHANEFAMIMTKCETMVALNIILGTEFVISNEAQKKLILNYELSYLKEEKIKKTVIPSHLSSSLQKLDKLNLPTGKINTVMVLVPGMFDCRTPHYIQHWTYQAQLLRDIGKTLRKAGIKSILKIRKDNFPDLTAEMHKSYYDIIESRPFEEVIDLADAYIFPHYIATTVLPWAMFTNRPIIMWDTVLPWLWEDIIPSFSKRCYWISSSYNQDGFIEYDENQLIRILKKEKHESINSEVCQKFFN